MEPCIHRFRSINVINLSLNGELSLYPFLCNNSFSRTMIDWINEALSTLAASINVNNPGGLAAIFLLTISADVGIPFPFVLDTILFFTTYTMGAFSLPVFLIVIILLSGRMLGTSVMYWVSRFLGTRLVDWVGKRSQSLRHNLEQFQNKLSRWSVPVIVAARLTPGFMQISSVAAGTLRVHYYQLVLAIVLSSIIYDGTLIILGTLARLGLKEVRPEYSAWVVIGFVVIMAVVLITIHQIRHRIRRS